MLRSCQVTNDKTQSIIRKANTYAICITVIACCCKPSVINKNTKDILIIWNSKEERKCGAATSHVLLTRTIYDCEDRALD